MADTTDWICLSIVFVQGIDAVFRGFRDAFSTLDRHIGIASETSHLMHGREPLYFEVETVDQYRFP